MSVTAGSNNDRPADAPGESGRDRIRRAAYELFSRSGVRAVGVDAVIARAGIAKMTLYRNFRSKNDLILDFLARREELWTNQWLIAEVRRRADQPADRLLAVFDVFSDWFGREDFEGCAVPRPRCWRSSTASIRSARPASSTWRTSGTSSATWPPPPEPMIRTASPGSGTS